MLARIRRIGRRRLASWDYKGETVPETWELKPKIEALLVASDRPVTIEVLALCLGEYPNLISKRRLRSLLLT
jgi:hypothetical protein